MWGLGAKAVFAGMMGALSAFFSSVTPVTAPTMPCPAQVGFSNPDWGSGHCTGDEQIVVALPTIEGHLIYNSVGPFSNTSTGFGVGWSWGLDRRIVVTSGAPTSLVLGDGTEIPLVAAESGTWVAADSRLNASKFTFESGQSQTIVETSQGGVRFNYRAVNGSSYLLSTKVTPDEKITSLSRLPAGSSFVARLSDPYNRTTIFTPGQSTSPNITQISDPVSNYYRFDYDTANRLTSIGLPDGTRYRFSYDRNLLTYVEYPTGAVKSISYVPGTAFVSSETDTHGNKTTFSYSANSVTVQDGMDTDIETFTKSGGGTFLTQLSVDGAVTTYTLDAQNRVVSITSPESQEWFKYASSTGYQLYQDVVSYGNLTTTKEYHYDSAGNVVSLVVTKGQTTKTFDFAWNSCTLPTSVSFNGTKTVINYDSACHLTGIVRDGQAVLSRLVDGKGNVVMESDWYRRTFHFNYDDYGNIIGSTDPLGRVETQEVSPLGYLTSRTLPGGITESFSLNPFGIPIGVQTVQGTRGTPSPYTDSFNISWGRNSNGSNSSYGVRETATSAAGAGPVTVRSTYLTFQGSNQLSSQEDSGVNGGELTMSSGGDGYSAVVQPSVRPPLGATPAPFPH